METEDKFKNSPIHDKRAILEMMDKLEPKEMVKVVDFIQEQVKLFSKSDVMPRFFFVFVQIGTDEYKILAEGIDTYDDAIEIRDAYKVKFKNQPFIVASLNET